MKRLFLTRTERGSAGWRQAKPQSRSLAKALLIALLTALFIQAWAWVPAPASVAQEQLLEDLKFRVEYLLWKDVARAQLTLKSLGPGRYQAEISGEPLGLLKVMTGQRRDSYQTEMIYREGKLMPLIYREKSEKKGKRYLKEYRFDYNQGLLEMWQLKDGKGTMVRKWHTALKGPVYDPLTAFYNCRLGLMGPIREGEVYKMASIPYPKPEEIEVRIGPESAEGRKIMIAINNKSFEDDRGVVYAFLDGGRVPRQAWTNARVGKISGERLDGGKALKGGLPGLPGENN